MWFPGKECHTPHRDMRKTVNHQFSPLDHNNIIMLYSINYSIRSDGIDSSKFDQDSSWQQTCYKLTSATLVFGKWNTLLLSLFLFSHGGWSHPSPWWSVGWRWSIRPGVSPVPPVVGGTWPPSRGPTISVSLPISVPLLFPVSLPLVPVATRMSAKVKTWQ